MKFTKALLAKLSADIIVLLNKIIAAVLLIFLRKEMNIFKRYFLFQEPTSFELEYSKINVSCSIKKPHPVTIVQNVNNLHNCLFNCFELFSVQELKNVGLLLR